MEIRLEGTAGAGGWPEPGCGCASCGRLTPGHRRPTSIVVDGRIRLPLPPGRAIDAPGAPDGYRITPGPYGYAITGPDGGRVLYAPPAPDPAPGATDAEGFLEADDENPARAGSGDPAGADIGDTGAGDGNPAWDGGRDAVRAGDGTGAANGDSARAGAGDTGRAGGDHAGTADENPARTDGGGAARGGDGDGDPWAGAGEAAGTGGGETGAGDRGPAGPYPGRPFDLVLIDLLDRPERLGELRRRGLVTAATQVVAVHLDHRVPSERELERRLAHWGAIAVPDGTVLDTRAPRDRPAPRPPRRTLLLGGARSGKSEEAELRVAADPVVTYVATGPDGRDDPAWLERVRRHRERRPRHWRTVETTDLAGVLAAPGEGTLLIDGIGTWLAAVFDECGAWPGDGGAAPPSALAAVARRCDELVAAWRRTRARVVAVSDEVGLGVVPVTAAGLLFRDVLGSLNQRLARESEEVALVVAGRPVPLPL